MRDRSSSTLYQCTSRLTWGLGKERWRCVSWLPGETRALSLGYSLKEQSTRDRELRAGWISMAPTNSRSMQPPTRKKERKSVESTHLSLSPPFLPRKFLVLLFPSLPFHSRVLSLTLFSIKSINLFSFPFQFPHHGLRFLDFFSSLFFLFLAPPSISIWFVLFFVSFFEIFNL